MTISKGDALYLRELVYSRSAIVIEDDKEYLLEARLGPVARDEGCETIGALVERVRRSGESRLPAKVVEAMTTNETTFFRDHSPFVALQKHVIPDLIARRSGTKSIDIWSAACSTGQEPYSLAMMLDDSFPQLRDWRIRIVATDIATRVLERARAACFGQHEVNRGLPARMLVKYFERDGIQWRLRDSIRNRVEFRQMNLMDPWTHGGPFDIVMMRNVLIYFDVETKKRLLARCRTALSPDGYLFLGGAETTLNLDDTFGREQQEQAVFYRPNAVPASSRTKR